MTAKKHWHRSRDWNRRIVWTFLFEAAGRKVACENSRPSSLPARVEFHGCFRRLEGKRKVAFHTITDFTLLHVLRACPCKNRPLKFSWKMDCLHFFYTSRATYAMNENGLYFDRFAFLIFWGIFFVGTPKTTQTGNWNPKNWGLRYACSNFAHSMKQPNSFRITA